jgi:hypothetical protein
MLRNPVAVSFVQLIMPNGYRNAMMAATWRMKHRIFSQYLTEVA